MMNYSSRHSGPDPTDAAAWGGYGRSKANEPPEPPPLHIINPVDLATQPVPRREWIVEDWLPIGCVAMNYGDGGTGKSLLAQQLMSATALGKPWCGLEVMPCRSFGLFCEDDEAELHRRQVDICGAIGANMIDLEAMRWVSGIGEDCSLVGFNPLGSFTTPMY